LEEDSRPVAGAGVAPLRTAVRQIFENLKTFADDLMRLQALDVHDEADAARIFLVLRVVQPLLRWKPWDIHHAYLVKKVGFFLPGGDQTERTRRRRLPLLLRQYLFTNCRSH
jgi:hypothetical protein